MDRIKRNTKLTVQMELILVSGRRRAELIKVQARLVTRRASQLVLLTARAGNERADSELQSSQTRASHELRIFCALLTMKTLLDACHNLVGSILPTFVLRVQTIWHRSCLTSLFTLRATEAQPRMHHASKLLWHYHTRSNVQYHL
jgi:hypothetical protein